MMKKPAPLMFSFISIAGVVMVSLRNNKTPRYHLLAADEATPILMPEFDVQLLASSLINSGSLVTSRITGDG